MLVNRWYEAIICNKTTHFNWTDQVLLFTLPVQNLAPHREDVGFNTYMGFPNFKQSGRTAGSMVF